MRAQFRIRTRAWAGGLVLAGVSWMATAPARAQGVVYYAPRPSYPAAPTYYYVYPPPAYVYPTQVPAYTPRWYVTRPQVTRPVTQVPRTVENGYYTSIWDYYRD